MVSVSRGRASGSLAACPFCGQRLLDTEAVEHLQHQVAIHETNQAGDRGEINEEEIVARLTRSIPKTMLAEDVDSFVDEDGETVDGTGYRPRRRLR
jgi:ribose 1,5-bisphosphokinase PhnN